MHLKGKFSHHGAGNSVVLNDYVGVPGRSRRPDGVSMGGGSLHLEA